MKFGQCEFGTAKYGAGTTCEGELNAFIIHNVSRRPVSIYIEPSEYTPIAPNLVGWICIKAGAAVKVESTRVNEGWLVSLQARGAIRYEEHDI